MPYRGENAAGLQDTDLLFSCNPGGKMYLPSVGIKPFVRQLGKDEVRP